MQALKLSSHTEGSTAEKFPWAKNLTQLIGRAIPSLPTSGYALQAEVSFQQTFSNVHKWHNGL